MSYRILVVNPHPADAAVTERTLVAAGYRSAHVGTFDEALHQIAIDCPDLLVTALRLGAFNGLHLALRCRFVRDDMPVIVVSSMQDATPDIARVGAHFLSAPIDQARFLAVLVELLAGRPASDPAGARCWPRKHAALHATVQQSSARVVELSYGGLRLELDRRPTPARTPIEIELPTLGVSIKAVPRWSRLTDEGIAWWCGVEVAPASWDAARRWRRIVDSVN